MIHKSLILAAAVVLVAAALPAPAAAEPLRMEAAGERMTPLGVMVTELRKAKLYGETGEALGEIEEVLASRGGIVTALVVQVGDGILGIGEREVLLRFDQVRRRGDRVVTQLSRAQLGAQPPWDK